MAIKVFVSSKMMELRDVREVVAKALDDREIEAWVYEADAGARPEGVVETSLTEVEAADIYVGLFWEKYGEVTVQEYHHARALAKPCFVYIRDKDIQREKALEDFLEDEVHDLDKGVTYDYFDSGVELGKQVADDIMAWLMRRHREMTAEIQEARVSQDEIARLQAEVDRLQSASLKPLPQGTAADYLAQQMRVWFETLGYRFEGYDVRAEDYFEWVINVPARRGYDRILVLGIEGEAELAHIAALRRAVDEHGTNEGWLVAARRKSQAACEEVEKTENRDLFCYTFDELLDERADFSGYLDWLEVEVKRQGIDRMYVPLACTKEELDPFTKKKIGESRYDESNGWIDGYIDRWLDDPSKEHISILGEFGTGKTWFALHYAWVAAQRYREAKERGVERPRLPLVIPLRDYAKAVSAESLFSEFFFRKHEIPLPGYSAFEQLNRMGKLLLVFDGFDEMAAKVDRQKMINNFWELAQVVVPGAKAILTCRAEHFPEAQEGRALLSAELKASTAKLTGQPPQFEVLGLEKFDDNQIRQVLSFQASPATVEQVMGNPQLLDLARRPIMTEYILEALPDIEAGKPVDLSRVYLYAVRRKMERDITAERTFTSLADKLYFLCELSWEMLSTDQMSLNYRLFPDRLRRLFGHAVQEQKDLDHWHYDMMGQAMLVRNADGDYTPAHRSLLEFFVAYKFAADLGVLPPDFTELARAQSHLDESAPPQDYTWSSYFRRDDVDEAGEIIAIPPLNAFSHESLAHLLTTIGHAPLTEAIRTLMEGMVDAPRLWVVVKATCGCSPEEVGFTGGNVATLLRRKAESFKDVNLVRAVLDGAELRSADLTGANLQGATMRDAGLSLCTLKAANLSETDLRRTVLARADLTHANLQAANLGEVNLNGAVLMHTNMCKANLLKAALEPSVQTICAIFAPGDEFIANGGTFGDIQIRPVVNHEDRELLTTLKAPSRYVYSLSYSPCGRYLACGCDKGEIAIFNCETGQMTFHTGIGTGSVSKVCFSPDGKNLASVGDEVAIWSTSDSSKLCEWGSTALAKSICYSPDGRIATGTRGGAIAIWKDLGVKTDLQLQTSGVVYDLEFSPCGRYLAAYLSFTGDTGAKLDVIELWDIEFGSRTWELRVDSSKRWIREISIDPNGTELAFAKKNKIMIVDLLSGQFVRELTGHLFSVNSVCYSSDGRLLVSSSVDNTLKVWNATTGKILWSVAGTRDCDGLELSRVEGIDSETIKWFRSRGAKDGPDW